MYVVLVKFRVTPESAAAFRQRVLTQAENSLAREEACRRFDVAFNPADPAECLLYELYYDRAAFDAHLATDHFREFDAAVAEQVVSKEVTCWELANG